MTRKTTKFARKRRATGGLYNGAEWLNTISKCRPYTTEILPGAVIDEPTQDAADKAIKKTREAFSRLKAGATPKQVDYLVRLGVSRATAQGYSRKQASTVIDKILARKAETAAKPPAEDAQGNDWIPP